MSKTWWRFWLDIQAAELPEYGDQIAHAIECALGAEVPAITAGKVTGPYPCPPEVLVDMGKGVDVTCPHCGAETWTGWICCARMACDERDAVGKVAVANANEIARLRGAILAALDNLENGPEGALTAEGALRLALADS